VPLLLALRVAARHPRRAALPTPWQLTTLVLGAVLAVAALTAVPARLGGRRPLTATL
jgi:putative ABC transport system permease protein